jgi:hypothetical protein
MKCFVKLRGLNIRLYSLGVKYSHIDRLGGYLDFLLIMSPDSPFTAHKHKKIIHKIVQIKNL